MECKRFTFSNHFEAIPWNKSVIALDARQVVIACSCVCVGLSGRSRACGSRATLVTYTHAAIRNNHLSGTVLLLKNPAIRLLFLYLFCSCRPPNIVQNHGYYIQKKKAVYFLVLLKGKLPFPQDFLIFEAGCLLKSMFDEYKKNVFPRNVYAFFQKKRKVLPHSFSEWTYARFTLSGCESHRYKVGYDAIRIPLHFSTKVCLYNERCG